MNSDSAICTRLLRLFPVKFIKDAFDSDNRLQSDIIHDIVVQNSPEIITTFVKNNFSITKQSIYVYKISPKYIHKKPIKAEDLELNILSQEESNGIFELSGTQTVKFSAKTYNEIELLKEVELIFLQPFKITIKGNYLIIKLTKLETNLRPYFGDNTEIFGMKKSDDESAAINKILSYFDIYHDLTLQKADLNKGLKTLWDNDVIDGKELSFRRTSSRATEIMDEDYLFKVKYPEEYKAMMKNPLEMCIFRYLGETDLMPPHFTCAASHGTFSILIYPSDVTQINFLVDEILRNN